MFYDYILFREIKINHLKNKENRINHEYDIRTN